MLINEIVLVISFPGGGKTTYTKNYTNDGYHRVNRDEIGGKLDNLPNVVKDLHKKGTKKFVLDNTYADIESRKSIIECAQALKIPIKCVWLNTSFEDAQFNACLRMVKKVGRLLGPEDFKTNKDPNLFPPVALFSYKKRFQKPTTAEGFATVEKVEFIRVKDPLYKNKALILDYDDTLRRSTGMQQFPTKISEVQILPGRKEKLNEYVKQGYPLFGISNQSGVAKGLVSAKDAYDCFMKTNELLGHDIKFHFCPHSIPPVCCYCRKPQVGNFVLLHEVHKLDPAQCIFVGDQQSDCTLSQRCGMKFIWADYFFK